MKPPYIAALVIALAATPTWAIETGPVTGNETLSACMRFAESMEGELFMQGACFGALNAVVFYAEELPEAVRFCKPREASFGQMARIVTKFIRNNPETTHLNFSFLAARAMQQSWPCKKAEAPAAIPSKGRAF